MKIRPARAEFFLADGQTDRQTDWRIYSRFSQFCERAWTLAKGTICDGGGQGCTLFQENLGPTSKF
jgi:hypothetical protein